MVRSRGVPPSRSSSSEAQRHNTGCLGCLQLRVVRVDGVPADGSLAILPALIVADALKPLISLTYIHECPRNRGVHNQPVVVQQVRASCVSRRRMYMVGKSIWVIAVVLCLVCMSATPSAQAQAVYGSITGAVTDPQGSGVAGAKVVVTNVTKGTTEEATTNESGNYTVTHLIPDSYKIRVEAPGFKAYEIPNVRVGADTAVRADAQLQVGSVTQSVEVTSEIPQLQTEKTDVATIFSTQEVESVPIFNRNFTTFQLLSPGAQIQGWGHAASENPQGSRQILTNGQHFAGTGFELDGTDNQDPILGIIVINPNLDSINEVKITSQDYDAEFGRAIGAIVTSQTKSGTNEIHGSAFDFERSNTNFAKDPFTQTKT